MRAATHNSRRCGALALVAMATALAGQFVAMSHEMAVRHFRCAEHGDLTHVATAALDAVELREAAKGAAIGSEDVLAREGHEHCLVTFTVSNGAPVPVVLTVARYAPPPAAFRAIPTITRLPGRAFVLASDPKTSPPSA